MSKFNQRKPCGIPFNDKLDNDSLLGRRNLLIMDLKFLGWNAETINSGTEPTLSNLSMALVNIETEKGVNTAATELPIKAAKMMKRKS
jgi:hypothetical protein